MDLELLSAFRDFVSSNPHILGGGDIVTLRRGEPAVRAAILAAVIAGVVIKDEGPAIDRFLFLVPPGDDVEGSARIVPDQFIAAYESLSGQSCDERAREWVEKRLVIEEAKSARFDAVLDTLSALPDKSALIVLRAERYRDDEVEPFVAEGAGTPLANEDVWVPQVTALAERSVAAVGDRKIYFALEVDELAPVRPELETMLKSVDRCGVMGETSETYGEPVIGKRVDQWDRWISEGHVGLALRDITALPDSIDSQKPFLRIQIMAKAGLTLQALAAIRAELEEHHDFDPPSRVRLARIAANAGADRLAGELLSPVRDKLHGREDLESALKTLEGTGPEDLADDVATRLEALFPGAEGTKRWNRLKALRARDYARLASLWRGDDERKAEFFERLGNVLGADGVPDYLSVIETFGDTGQADRARLSCVEDALSRGLVIHAFDLVLQPVATEALLPSWDALMLDVIRRCFITGDADGNPPVEFERLTSAVDLLLQRLAHDPRNERVRAGIIDVLRPDVAGTAGVALLATVALEAAATPIKLRKGFRFGSASMDWLRDRSDFVAKAFDWLEGESPIIMGKLALPRELLTVDPDEAVTAIRHYLEVAPISDESDTNSLQLYLALAATIAPYTSDPNLDLRLTSLVAGKLVSNGLSHKAATSSNPQSSRAPKPRTAAGSPGLRLQTPTTGHATI